MEAEQRRKKPKFTAHIQLLCGSYHLGKYAKQTELQFKMLEHSIHPGHNKYASNKAADYSFFCCS